MSGHCCFIALICYRNAKWLRGVAWSKEQTGGIFLIPDVSLCAAFFASFLGSHSFCWVDWLLKGKRICLKVGPYILAANHFHFSDPVALLYLCDRQVEFVGGFRFPNAPAIVKFLPKLWGYFPVHRGAYSRSSLDYAVATLEKGGVVGIFPEGGAWAQVLRYPRNGIGFIAAETKVPIVPVGLTGFTGLFKIWRPQLTIQIGEPIGPFEVNESMGNRKDALSNIGVETMQAIAKVLPSNERGVLLRSTRSKVCGRRAGCLSV